jgi:hypothetical protein
MKGVDVCALVGMVIGATLFGWSDADAVLCVAKNKKGAVTKVTIRGAACKGKESVGDPSVLLGLPTTTTPPTTTTTLPRLTGGPRFVDSAGNDVGSLISFASFGVAALRTIDGQATVFPMSSDGPGFRSALVPLTVDDFQYQFVHQGTQCVGGDRLSLGDTGTALSALFGGDLLKVLVPSADGKSGYSFTSEVITEVSTGSYSQEDFKYACALGFPPTVTCDDDPQPNPPGVVTPVGESFVCQLNTSPPPLEGTQCSCIRCCVTREVQPPDPPISLYRVETVDLGLGNSTPPFKVAQ